MSLSAYVCSRLQHLHETIHALLNGFSEEQLRQRIHKDKWSAFEQVAHLVSYQPDFLQRLQTIQKMHHCWPTTTRRLLQVVNDHPTPNMGC